MKLKLIILFLASLATKSSLEAALDSQVSKFINKNTTEDIDYEEIKNVNDKLRVAARMGSLKTVYASLTMGANIDAVDIYYGKTPLIEASIKGHAEIVKALLAWGANINIANKRGYTALMWATRINHPKIMVILLDHGAEVNHTDKEGNTALMIAINYSTTEVLKTLLNNIYVNINIANQKGETAIEIAAKLNLIGTVKALLELGAHIPQDLSEIPKNMALILLEAKKKELEKYESERLADKARLHSLD